MKLEELYEAIEKDLIIDRCDLGNESARGSNIFIKYMKIYTNEKVALASLKLRVEELVRQKTRYYQGKADPDEYKDDKDYFKYSSEKKTNAQVDQLVQTDKDIIEMRERIIIREEKVNLLSEVMKEINRRSFNIRNAIDYEKFQAGVV